MIPKPSCTPLYLNSDTDRKTEVKLMSLFYENNLLNSFLFRRSVPGVSSPLCPCGSEDQTAAHVLLHCPQVDPDVRARARDCLGDTEVNHVTLLNLSRNRTFINILYDVIYYQGDSLRDCIELT